MNIFYSLILTYKYAILLPAAIIEGPIITVIAGFLSSLGFLNIFIVFLIGFLGDVIGDIIYYSLGRFGSKTLIPKYGNYFGITEERIKYAKDHYDKHLAKTIIFGKVTQAPILIILIVAGITKVDFRRFVTTVILISIPKSILFTLIGFYFGKSYILIGHYINNSLESMAIVLSAVIIFYFVFNYFRKFRKE